jgi:hypothetical protein
LKGEQGMAPVKIIVLTRQHKSKLESFVYNFNLQAKIKNAKKICLLFGGLHKIHNTRL